MTYTDTPHSSLYARPLWHDPMFWGVVGSLGLHVVFWVVAPFLPEGDRRSESEIQRPVELVELSPAEKQRLPDFLTDDVPLPEVAPSSSLPVPQNMPLTQVPGRPQVRFSPTLSPFFVPPPPTELPSYRPNFRPRTRVQVPERQVSVVPSATPSARPSISPSPSPSAPSPASPPANSPGNSPLVQQPEETPPTQTDSSPQPANPGRRPRFNRPNHTRQTTSPQLTAARQAQAEQPELFAFNGRGTTPDERTQADVDWLTEAITLVGEDYDPKIYEPDSEDFPLVEVTPPYPEEACIQRLQGTAIVGLVVGPDGKPLEDSTPMIIQSSGYGFLNDRAKQIAQEYDYEAKDKRLAYRVVVTFTPDQAVCEPYLQRLQNGQPSTVPSDAG